MKTRARLLGATVAALCVSAAPMSVSGVGAQSADNSSVAVNTHDGKDVFRLAFHVNRVMADTVDSTNAAVAFASCADCQTVAIAIQVVLIMSDPTVASPENVAIAINYQCSLCDTLASAYQLVLSTDGPLRLTPEAQRSVAEIRKKLGELRRTGLTGAELQAQIDALTQELKRVVTTGLVAAGRSGEATAGREAPSGASTTTTTAGTIAGTSTSTTSTTSTTSSTSTTSASTTSTTRQ